MTGFVLVTLLSAANLFGQKAREPKGISGASANRRATEKIIREYLLKNPELIRDAMQALQTKEDKQKNLVTAGNMKKFRSKYSSRASPAPSLGTQTSGPD